MLEETTGGVSRMLVDNSLESHKPVVSPARRSIGTSTLVRNAPLSVQNRTDLPDSLILPFRAA